MIKVSNLTKKFGEFVALDDVSFEINDGETFALLGPNGSGKTTTLKCLIGLTIPSSGAISIDDLDISRQAQEAKRLMSYLPQRVSFPEQLTAREVLQFFCRLRRLPPSRIAQTLETPNFHFNGFSDKPVNQFSGGMLQRLGLAVACLPNAPILVLDEPTMSLDPEGAIQFRQFLNVLKREGRTIVFSSHMLADVEELADRVAIMVGGRLVALKSIAELRDELMRSSRMRVVLANNSKSLLEAARTAGADDATLDGDALLVTSGPEKRLDILRAVEAAGGRVSRFATEELSLEDIYVRYVSEETQRK